MQIASFQDLPTVQFLIICSSVRRPGNKASMQILLCIVHILCTELSLICKPWVQQFGPSQIQEGVSGKNGHCGSRVGWGKVCGDPKETKFQGVPWS